jgi:hypothetical protein
VVLERLEASGVRFRLDAEKIKAKLPQPSPPEVLVALETLRARHTEVMALLRERHKQTLPACASPECVGCYRVEAGREIHAPRASEEWEAWLKRWEPKGKVQ